MSTNEPRQNDDGHEREPTKTVRHCDVAIIGGSAAGLAAALQVQRQARSVIVIDSGEPRNQPAEHMHGYPGFDGAAPSDLIAAARAEVRSYGAECLSALVTDVERNRGGVGFAVHTDRSVVRSRRVIVATGMADVLPSIEGIDRHWGDAVIHCPFCHGYEIRDRRVVQIIDRPAALHPAQFFSHLTESLELLVDGSIPDHALAALERSGVRVSRGRPARVIENADGRLTGIELSDGTELATDTIAVTTMVEPRLAPFSRLPLDVVDHPAGIARIVDVDPRGETSVPGVFAAGNLTDPSHQVLTAAAHGSSVGAMVALSLVEEELAGGTSESTRSSSNTVEWEARYAGDQVWSGSPNGSLVVEVETLEPGRALDIGAGEGGDAIWLAERGWTVVASDIAAGGLDRLTTVAADRGLDVTGLVADANGLAPFGDEPFDLVSLCYSAIPRTGDDRGIANILGAVAAGGTLVVIGHEPPAEPGTEHAMPWDAGAYVGAAAIETAIRAAIERGVRWSIDRSEIRDRPVGSVSHGHHDTDVVFRATRHT